MAKRIARDFIVGLDIGTSKISALVGEITGDGIKLIGVGTGPSRGLKRGMVINIDATVHSIRQAIDAAEKATHCSIHRVYTGIAGSHIRSLNSHGIVAIQNQEVLQADIDRVIEAAQAVAIPADQKILHILPQQFIIDKQEGIREPIGMSGVRLEAKVHMVTGATSAVQNIIKCVQRCGLEVAGVILEQLASSLAILTEDEKELGACVLDIGGGTTDIAVFTDGAIRHTAVIPIAGDQVSNDIAIALRTTTQSSEDIKIKQGHALMDLVDPEELVDIPSMGDRPSRRITKRTLAEVIGARYEELFNLVRMELRRHNLEQAISAGIILTGGASNISGCAELAEMVFQMPVRIGNPQYISDNTATIKDGSYATGVGLLLYGLQQQYERPAPRTRTLKSFYNRVKFWLRDRL